jgi:hypothetical protein
MNPTVPQCQHSLPHLTDRPPAGTPRRSITTPLTVSGADQDPLTHSLDRLPNQEGLFNLTSPCPKNPIIKLPWPLPNLGFHSTNLQITREPAHTARLGITLHLSAPATITYITGQRPRGHHTHTPCIPGKLLTIKSSTHHRRLIHPGHAIR